MNKRYWFISITITSPTAMGNANLGFISSDEDPFSNNAIVNGIIKKNPSLKPENVMVMYFYEFKNEIDYNLFFDKR
jgi:hypothetical protein